MVNLVRSLVCCVALVTSITGCQTSKRAPVAVLDAEWEAVPKTLAGVGPEVTVAVEAWTPRRWHVACDSCGCMLPEPGAPYWCVDSDEQLKSMIAMQKSGSGEPLKKHNGCCGSFSGVLYLVCDEGGPNEAQVYSWLKTKIHVWETISSGNGEPQKK